MAWGAACYKHGILQSSQWNSIRVSGLTAQDQLLLWLETGNRTSVVSQGRLHFILLCNLMDWSI